MIYFSVVFCSNVLWISVKLNLQVNSWLHFVWLRILDSPYILSVWISFIIWLVPWVSSSETQRQLGVRMRYVRLREIFGLKSTSRVREPVWKYFYRTSSRSVQSPSRWLARKNIFLANQREVLQGDSVAILHKVVFLIDRGTCSSFARTTGRFSWRVSCRRGTLRCSEHPNYLENVEKYRNITHKKSSNIITR